MTDKKQQDLSYGEQVVGKNFNPAQDKKVARLKELFAEAVDIINEHPITGDEALHATLKGFAINQALSAQMHSVKVVTFGK
jgi:hypothetical protein